MDTFRLSFVGALPPSTYTAHSAVRPLKVLAVTTALPPATAVTLPLSSTVATASLLLAKVTFEAEPLLSFVSSLLSPAESTTTLSDSAIFFGAGSTAILHRPSRVWS